MKLITWNVNGLRSVMSKVKDGTKQPSQCTENVVRDILTSEMPDFLCLQEIKCSDGVDMTCIGLESLGYVSFLNCSKARKGYSGTAIFAKHKPMSVRYDFESFSEDEELNREGRMITLEYPKFYVVTCYVPNSKPDLSRLPFRLGSWESTMRLYINALQSSGKHVLFSGDLNVAAQEIDVHNPSSAKGTHGFTDQERSAFQQLIKECNMIDTYRELHPNDAKYSWYSPFAQSRKRGKGWRIDYWLVSKKVKSKVVEADILSEYYGSDHVPCVLGIDLRV